MTIDVHFNNATVAELQIEMRALLNGEPPTRAVSAGNTGAAGATMGPTGSETLAEKPLTAAQKKAADKAAKEAAEAAAKQGIQTGGERVDPEADKQDAKDEAAETAATKPVDLTHDDVKKMLGGYVMAYGMEAAQADGVSMISAPKISEIPNTQPALAKAILGIATTINSNPHKRDLNGDGLSAEKTAELKVIVQAAQAVK